MAQSNAQGLTTLTLDNFSAFIGQAEKAVVYFSAPWCQPCHHLRPAVQQFAAEHAALASYGEVDVSASPTLSQRYGIRSVPVLVVFLQATVVAQLPGQVEVFAQLKQLLQGAGN